MTYAAPLATAAPSKKHATLSILRQVSDSYTFQWLKNGFDPWKNRIEPVILQAQDVLGKSIWTRYLYSKQIRTDARMVWRKYGGYNEVHEKGAELQKMEEQKRERHGRRHTINTKMISLIQSVTLVPPKKRRSVTNTTPYTMAFCTGGRGERSNRKNAGGKSV